MKLNVFFFCMGIFLAMSLATSKDVQDAYKMMTEEPTFDGKVQLKKGNERVLQEALDRYWLNEYKLEYNQPSKVWVIHHHGQYIGKMTTTGNFTINSKQLANRLKQIFENDKQFIKEYDKVNKLVIELITE